MMHHVIPSVSTNSIRSVLVPKDVTVRGLTADKLQILSWFQSKDISKRSINVIILTPPDVEKQPPLRSVFCLKNRKRIEEVEKVEDCFILEFDPYESFDLSQLRKNIDQIDKYAPNIAVVAEKGKVACRDYPHPRHLCVVHPFNKTAHQIYCKLCYCYVCDKPAPCKKWIKDAHNTVTMRCDATQDLALN